MKSTVHRVIFPESKEGEESKDRYSIAYFVHPIGNTVLETVPSERVKLAGLVEDGKDGKNGIREKTGVEAMTAHEHLMSRLQATYKGLYKDGEKEGTAKEVVASA